MKRHRHTPEQVVRKLREDGLYSYTYMERLSADAQESYDQVIGHFPV